MAFLDWTEPSPHHDPSAPSRRLLLAVIAQAIEDASRPPTPAEINAKANRLQDPIQALRWLFAPSPVLEWYAGYVEIDPERLRAKLIEAIYRYADDQFRADQRRVFRLRYQWARRDGLFAEPYDPMKEDAYDDEDGGSA